MSATNARSTHHTRRMSSSVFARFFRRPLALATSIYLILVLFAAVAPQLLTAVDPLSPDLLHVLATPTAGHWLGTDALGRDLLARVIYGTGPALLGVLITVAVAAIVGIPIGLASALAPRVDAVMTRVSDVILAIPGIVVLLMVLAVSDNLNWAMVGMGLLTAPGLIRVVRGASLAVVGEQYIAAARVFGVGRLKIAMRHVLPRVAGPIIVNLSLIAATALVTEAGLNFLGLGLEPPTPSWGGLVADGAAVMNQEPWTLVPGGGIIALTVIAFILLGDAVRDVTTESWAAGRTKGARLTKSQLREIQSAARTTAALGNASAPGSTGLSVRDLTIAFPSPAGELIPVVESISFDVKEGESVGVVGESGSGKTITGLGVLRMLPSAAVVRSGSIWFDGQELTALRKKDRAAYRGSTIAFVSQEPMNALDPLFTVGSQIAEALKVHTPLRGKAVTDRVRELLTQVQIIEPQRVMRMYPHEISGGMAQRVAIAIALAGSPALLIADEPTTALDVTVQADIVSLLRNLQQDSGMSLLLISHDWGVVSAACDRAIVMYAGQIVEESPIDDIFDRPLHPYTEGLLAANPHFAVPGERLIAIPGTVPVPADWPLSCHFADRCPYAMDACREGPIAMASVGERTSRCIRAELPTHVPMEASQS